MKQHANHVALIPAVLFALLAAPAFGQIQFKYAAPIVQDRIQIQTSIVNKLHEKGKFADDPQPFDEHSVNALKSTRVLVVKNISANTEITCELHAESELGTSDLDVGFNEPMLTHGNKYDIKFGSNGRPSAIGQKGRSANPAELMDVINWLPPLGIHRNEAIVKFLTEAPWEIGTTRNAPLSVITSRKNAKGKCQVSVVKITSTEAAKLAKIMLEGQYGATVEDGGHSESHSFSIECEVDIGTCRIHTWNSTILTTVSVPRSETFDRFESNTNSVRKHKMTYTAKN